VIFGSGSRLRFPKPMLLQPLMARRIGFETMDTAAACRTYNVLLAEGRAVVRRCFSRRPVPDSGAPGGAGRRGPAPIICGYAWTSGANRTEYFMTPALNKPIPEFEALATGGVKFTPQAYAGKIVVLYFYPKDNTPGCTTEAMQFRDHYREFVKAGAVLFGVSRDNMASHDKFKQSLELPFELIADTEEKLCHMFGVVKNKIMYGKKVKGIERSTFLIDGTGVLRAEWRGLTVAGHVDEVLKAVKAIKKAV
jgi:peroxiredoxin Q/BCP